MSITLSHREALDRARQAGILVARLHGRPDLVIGIRRAGVAVAMAFAQGAGGARTVYVTRRAETRPRIQVNLSRLGRQLMSPRLRQFCRSLFYRPGMGLLMKLQTPVADSAPFIEEHAQLHDWLANAKSVVVVDDAIDTGVTMGRLVQAIQAEGLHRSIITFALTSTLGVRVHQPQHHLFEDVVEYVEGDLGLLDAAAAARALADLEPAARHLEWRLQDLLLCPLHECVARALIRALESSGSRLGGIRLRVRCALWRLNGQPDDNIMEDLYLAYDALPASGRRIFGIVLTTEVFAALQPLARTAAAHGEFTVPVMHGPWVTEPVVQALRRAGVLAD